MAKKIVFIFVLYAAPFFIHAQNKYAVIIGINDYYEVKGTKSEISLKGSVNDANAIRDLLINKFGFKSKNIDTVYNANATRDNIINAFKKKLKQCKPGDAMVVYYSGHGVYLNNTQENADTVKQGMNQAILTSDLYNYDDHLKCFLRDFTLKQYFNLFIDKKVIVTALFDCCFSGKLAMANPFARDASEQTKSVDVRALMGRLTASSPNAQLLIDSISGVAVNDAPGCNTDSAGVSENATDSDSDGVPDCKDKEKLTDRQCFPVDSNGVGSCSFDYLLGMFRNTINTFDSAEFIKNNDATENEKAFNDKEVLTISEKDTIRRPADRKNSAFLFMSAATDRQKAVEFNVNGVRHSLFTAALIRVFEKDAAATSAQNIFNDLMADMDSYKKNQTPTLSCDPARKNKNLLGILLK